ncbi:transmembrane protein, putative (macronuclear) [Tetrahymena thermophila SB210]|uniref:Transmembrane protein, putative n=1 Tax=Tetrahymena thermophila (strain SB210) TaxID=312017 RepID=W7XGT4_TETTS|nr:transmembrane protein, putative [Tetrahymena thermophila SB210]EWS76263.1 transmembrane protein, putative [Tetrahymena thermophila SB210]|eukprot:XP_012651222.1 transmembrane protein, putative [Tetrahymena thermophila SB210]
MFSIRAPRTNFFKCISENSDLKKKKNTQTAIQSFIYQYFYKHCQLHISNQRSFKTRKSYKQLKKNKLVKNQKLLVKKGILTNKCQLNQQLQRVILCFQLSNRSLKHKIHVQKDAQFVVISITKISALNVQRVMSLIQIIIYAFIINVEAIYFMIGIYMIMVIQIISVQLSAVLLAIKTIKIIYAKINYSVLSKNPHSYS